MCPKCRQDDPRMVEEVQFIVYKDGREVSFYTCAVCAHHWQEPMPLIQGS